MHVSMCMFVYMYTNMFMYICRYMYSPGMIRGASQGWQRARAKTGPRIPRARRAAGGGGVEGGAFPAVGRRKRRSGADWGAV